MSHSLELTPAGVSAAVFLLVITLFYAYCRTYLLRIWDRLCGRVPPGPPAFPVIGTVNVDHLHPEITFRKWAIQYGNIFSFFLGGRFCIAVGDMDLIRKLFKDDRFNGRSQVGLINYIDGEPWKGIILGNGDLWKEHRRFSLTALRDFGFGKSSGGEYVEKEAVNLLALIKEQDGRSFDPKNFFTTVVANVVSGMLFSSSFHGHDSRFREFADNVSENMQEFVHSGLLEVYPWLRWIPPFSGRLKALNARHTEGCELLASLIRDHRKSFDAQHPRDYIDAFFCMQEENKRTGRNEGTFTDVQLVRNLADLFVAGFETTSTFLRWSMIYMILHPEIQTKVQAEIDTVVGQSRIPKYADRPKMPYTDAVTLEIHRISSFVPFGVPHCATESVEFEGYTIPKGTEIWPLFCHHFANPAVWGDAEIFRPERFLDVDGNLIAALVEEIQPFSVGRRACLGEPLARMETFSFFAAILQNFTLTSRIPPSTNSIISAVRAPEPFTMIATARS